MRQPNYGVLWPKLCEPEVDCGPAMLRVVPGVSCPGWRGLVVRPSDLAAFVASHSGCSSNWTIPGGPVPSPQAAVQPQLEVSLWQLWPAFWNAPPDMVILQRPGRLEPAATQRSRHCEPRCGGQGAEGRASWRAHSSGSRDFDFDVCNTSSLLAHASDSAWASDNFSQRSGPRHYSILHTSPWRRKVVAVFALPAGTG